MEELVLYETTEEMLNLAESAISLQEIYMKPSVTKSQSKDKATMDGTTKKQIEHAIKKQKEKGVEFMSSESDLDEKALKKLKKSTRNYTVYKNSVEDYSGIFDRLSIGGTIVYAERQVRKLGFIKGKGYQHVFTRMFVTIKKGDVYQVKTLRWRLTSDHRKA